MLYQANDLNFFLWKLEKFHKNHLYFTVTWHPGDYHLLSWGQYLLSVNNNVLTTKSNKKNFNLMTVLS